ncbi:MAG: hypothetical protein F2712_03145 [Actinobacteria bacterium]|uniref:Unannotated protein n=1 Tax=freshwater metagenome TaxID=449393 RepID=A0A6J6UIK6_9ZZZZ|nr:hypothetical protein [Actinomycetota bacterium]
MSTDLSKTSSEVVETNSLREIFLFCAVLLVEIYCLAVSFGGPFFEVGYFLLVVISQTLAGAYIWAQLRQSDKTLPLPELLAMGFAIGSASAAISQLIIRDLLGIRLFLSPLVPIIGVAIWLITKRDPLLPVKVSHATTNTLLWLLFPAPLALMTYSMFLLPVFIAPMLLVIYVAQRKHGLPNKLNRNLFAIVSLYLFSGTLLHRYLFASLTKFKIGIDAYADDILFDVVQSIGFAKWGINTNIELASTSEAYYKISHLWLAPIMNFDGQSLMNVSITVLPIMVVLMIGLSLFAITLQMCKNPRAAGMASCLYFAQSDFNQSFSINLRSVWLMGSFYLIVSGILTLRIVKVNKAEQNILLIFAAFILAGSRIFFAPFMISMVFLIRHQITPSIRAFLIKNTLTGLWILVGASIAILLFAQGTDSTQFASMIISAADWPVSQIETFKFVVRTTMPRLVLFISLILIHGKYKKWRLYILASTTIFVLIQFLSPRVFAFDNYVLVPYMMILTPVFSIVIEDIWMQIREFKFNTSFIVLVISIGLFLKISRDAVRDELNYNNLLKDLVINAITNEYLINLSLLICCAFLTVLFTSKLRTRAKNFRLPILVFAVFLGSIGVQMGGLLRPLTEYVRYDEKFWGGDRDPLLDRWDDDVLLSGLKQVNSLSFENDVIASNFGLNRSFGFTDGIRSQIFIDRRYLVSGRYKYFNSLPLIYKEKYSADSSQNRKTNDFAIMLRERIETSMDFPNYPSRDLLANMRKENVKWFVVDLGNTTLRDWEPWATTRFMNEKVAILELAQAPVPSN